MYKKLGMSRCQYMPTSEPECYSLYAKIDPNRSSSFSHSVTDCLSAAKTRFPDFSESTASLSAYKLENVFAFIQCGQLTCSVITSLQQFFAVSRIRLDRKNWRAVQVLMGFEPVSVSLITSLRYRFYTPPTNQGHMRK